MTAKHIFSLDNHTFIPIRYLHVWYASICTIIISVFCFWTMNCRIVPCKRFNWLFSGCEFSLHALRLDVDVWYRTFLLFQKMASLKQNRSTVQSLWDPSPERPVCVHPHSFTAHHMWTVDPKSSEWKERAWNHSECHRVLLRVWRRRREKELLSIVWSFGAT